MRLVLGLGGIVLGGLAMGAITDGDPSALVAWFAVVYVLGVALVAASLVWWLGRRARAYLDANAEEDRPRTL